MRKVLCILCFLSVAFSVRGADGPLRRARELVRHGQWAAAEYELGQAERHLDADDVSGRCEADFLSALCRVKLGSRDAGDALAAFSEKYPNSVWGNQVRFYQGTLLYNQGDYEGALASLLAVNPHALDAESRDEYNFKTGHSYFNTENWDAACIRLNDVSPKSSYYPHARYYIGYMDYVRGNNGRAREIFTSLASNRSYADVVPYYLLQLEFADGNYEYVTGNGDKLLAGATPERRTELLRVLAESWFHLSDFYRADRYIKKYEAEGGDMGRSENYIAGFSLYKEDDYRNAAPYLAKVCSADDALSQNASYHLADCYLKTGDKTRAMQSFSIASSRGMNDEISRSALFNYGKLQFELGSGRFNETINVLNRYLAEYPDSPEASQVKEYLISAYYNSQNYSAAYDAIIRYPNPDNDIKAALQKITYFRALEYYGQGDLQNAERLLADASRYGYNAKYKALTYFWQGEILYARGEYKEAIDKYARYLALSPASEQENVMARYGTAYSYFGLQDWEQAQKWFEDFLSRYKTKDDYMADAFNRLGDTQHSQRAYWRAIECYDKAAAVGGDQKYYSAYQRAMMLGLVDRPQRKIESLNAIIKDGGGEWVDDAMYELGRTYMVQGDYAAGARTFENFIKAYPASERYSDALSNIGLAYQNMGDGARALDYYKRIVERAPKSSEAAGAAEAIREIYVDNNDVNGYFDFARRAGFETDLSARQRDSLSFAAAQKVYVSGDADKAVSALENYLASNPDGMYVPQTLYFLGECRRQLGDRKGAVAEFTALCNMKDNDYTVRGLERLSSLAYAEKLYRQAADAYERLSGSTTEPETVRRAVEGFADATIAEGDTLRILAACEQFESGRMRSDAKLRELLFAKAGILTARGYQSQALDIYGRLSEDVSDVQGAESAYRVIEALYRSGDMRAAEKKVFEFSESGTPHSYWLGKAFITLGDIYVADGDTFQARATYQSIVDGYSPATDGIVGTARERIGKLK